MQATYVFAEFELDGARFELRRDGRRVAIQPKELRLLLYLVAHRGRVAATTELLAALWPRETVCTGSLKRAVRGARRALGDDGSTQSRIRTVRGYGYEFVEAVTEVIPHLSPFRFLAPYPRFAVRISGDERHGSALASTPSALRGMGPSLEAAPQLALLAYEVPSGPRSEPSGGVGS